MREIARFVDVRRMVKADGIGRRPLFLYRSSLCPRSVMNERVFKDDDVSLRSECRMPLQRVCMLYLENDLHARCRRTCILEREAHGCFDSRHLISAKLPSAASCSQKLGGNQKKLKIADIEIFNV